jgi:hypothetical protein
LIVSSNNISRGQSLFPFLREIKKFIQENPKEFIIVKIKGEGTNLRGFCNNIVADFIIKEFKDNLITKKDFDEWFEIETVTMGEIAKRNKQVIFLVPDNFFETFLNKMDKDMVENSEIARDSLMEKGIFPIAKFLRDEKFKTDDIHELLTEMDKSFQNVIKKVMRVNHYTLTALKKLQIKYIWKPPTINGMEKNEFFKNNLAIGHLIENINKGKDVNIGTFYFPSLN